MSTPRLPSLLLILLATVTTSSGSSDHYLLSCGATSNVSNTPSTYDGQTWHSDNNSTFSDNFSSTVEAVGISTTSAFYIPNYIPFSAARIFTANFSYSFQVSPGPKFIRLFFYPANYSSFSPSDSYLTLRTNTGHLLLRNFSAYLSTSSFMVKEFYVHVSTTLLHLTFSPTPPSSHAFINGIEIVSVPDTLYVGPTAPKDVADPDVQFQLTNSTALETAYRLNVGGKDVSLTEDSGAMNRPWVNDEPYLIDGFNGSTGLLDNQTMIQYTAATPNYTAPTVVYQTLRWMGEASYEVRRRVNVTWGFEVDLGFNYLLRLHWCELDVQINATNDRVFDVYIDDMIAEEGADIFYWVGADTAVYRDYIVYMDPGINGSRGVLQLAMHPNTRLQPRSLEPVPHGRVDIE